MPVLRLFEQVIKSSAEAERDIFAKVGPQRGVEGGGIALVQSHDLLDAWTSLCQREGRAAEQGTQGYRGERALSTSWEMHVLTSW